MMRSIFASDPGATGCGAAVALTTAETAVSERSGLPRNRASGKSAVASGTSAVFRSRSCGDAACDEGKTSTGLM
jgi:hypothetical protein